MRLETSYYTLIHRLTHWCSIWWQKTNFIFFFPSAWNFLFTPLTYSSNKMLSIQVFLCDWYLQRILLYFLKSLFFFFALPITNIGVLLPTALTADKKWSWFWCAYQQAISLFSTDTICLVNIEKTPRIPRRCKYSQDRN